MKLELRSRWAGRVLVVQCAGRLIVGEAAQALHRQIAEALAETPFAVVNLADVQFLDSSGLGTLVRLAGQARMKGGDVKLCCVPQAIRKTLELTSLNRVFECHATEEEALDASYRGQTMPGMPGAARRVLLVGASADFLAFAGQILRAASYEVITASNTPDARVLLKASKPHLVIVGGEVSGVGSRNAADVLREVGTGVRILNLEAGVAALEPAEARERLLQTVRAALPA
jgi:anti-sigma B factor antagonist